MTSSSGLRARIVGALVTVMLPVALRWLQPPKLFSRNTIDESLPPAHRLHDGRRILWIENRRVRQGQQLRI
jgi:hypothetical protein